MKKVSAALIEQGGEFLIARRSAKDTLGGFWEFPGGKVEKGLIESPIQTETSVIHSKR